MTPVVALLPGERLHLQHGPIDLVIGADGARRPAFDAAATRFQTILAELVPHLPRLRAPALGAAPAGAVAARMWDAVAPFPNMFVTPMAAVAGCVADEILAAMCAATPLRRAYVNNGGDIALHLGPRQSFDAAIHGLDGSRLGRVRIAGTDPVRGLATSGWSGRSLSLGIADSVTVLARNAGAADVAATLIANAVDLPGHPAVMRRPARDLDPDSDLGARRVVTGCGTLAPSEIRLALQSGLRRARTFKRSGRIVDAALCLRGETVATCPSLIATSGKPTHA